MLEYTVITVIILCAMLDLIAIALILKSICMPEKNNPQRRWVPF